MQMSDHSANVTVFKSRVIPCPAEPLWAMLRDFDSPRLWNPGVAKVELSAGCHDIGCVRALFIHDGKIFRERLLACDDDECVVTYAMVDCPMPVSDYVASNRVIPITATGQSLAIWQSRFRCRPEDQQELARYFGVSAYEEGLEGIEKMMLSS